VSGAGGRLAVIPARGGSKRIPGKNLVDLGGQPLLAYTVRAAVDSGLFARVIVSTDSEEIAAVAESLGAEAPFLREPGLSDDFVPVSAATVDALERVDPGADAVAGVCQLMPNCPLRTAADVVASCEQFEATGGEAQISVVRYGWQNPWWAMRRSEEYVLDPLFPEAHSARSQDLDELYCPTGAVWWAQAGALRREGTFHMPGRTGWEIAWQHGVDIDTPDDLDLALVLLELERRGRD
jgi:N-acylneuraminate cytidylyltransferase